MKEVIQSVEEILQVRHNCPSCLSNKRALKERVGRLVIKEGKYRKFIGCSFFPLCDYRVSLREFERQFGQSKLVF